MTRSRLVYAAFVYAWLGVAHAGADDPQSPQGEGLAAYEAGNYGAALAHFRRAAGTGDARSAEILALMLRFGPRLYPRGVPADPAEAAKWAAMAVAARAAEPTPETRSARAAPY